MFKFILRPLARTLTKIAWIPRLRYHAVPFGSLSYTSHERAIYHATYFAKTSRLEGDYLEFGTWNGSSFIAAYWFAEMHGLKRMHFYGFDSFEGLPKLEAEDARGFRHFEGGDYACSQEQFEFNLKKSCIDMKRVTLVKGFYSDSLTPELKTQLPIEKAAIIMVDCDLYSSTVDCLNFVTDYVQDGTVMLFDDWFAYRGDPDRGEQKAFREWLKRNPTITATEYHKFAVCGNSFILNVKDSVAEH